MYLYCILSMLIHSISGKCLRSIEKDKIKENKSFEEEIKEIATIDHSLDKIVLLGTDNKNERIEW